MNNGNLQDDVLKFFKKYSKGAESLRSRAVSDIESGIPNLDNEKDKAFCQKSLDDLLNGKANPLDVINRIKNL